MQITITNPDAELRVTNEYNEEIITINVSSKTTINPLELIKALAFLLDLLDTAFAK